MHSEKPKAGSSRIDLLINDCNIQVEIADTPGSRSHGLMQRKALDPNCGMLFVFPDEVRRSFWMKETYIPLSIAYLNEQGVILNIADMEPHGTYKKPNEVSCETACIRSVYVWMS